VKQVFTLAFIFLLAAAPSSFSQQVATFVDTDSLRVGDIFELTYVVQGTYNSISYPDADDFDESLDLLSRQRFQTSAGRDSLVYRFQFFATDNITIPGKEITLHRSDSDTTLTTSRVPLYFKTVLASEDEEFRPLKPIFDFARAVWPFIVGLILLGILSYLLYRWFVSREPAPQPVQIKKPEPFLDPLKALKDELNSLPAVHQLNAKSDYENYYIVLGDAIRRYIKRVYEFPALEMTTREITTSLQQELAPSEIIKITRSVLNEADMVKFANFRPDTALAEGVRKKADEFVETAEVTDREKIDHLKFRYEQAIAESETQKHQTIEETDR
jgi:hypothetical protein